MLKKYLGYYSKGAALVNQNLVLFVFDALLLYATKIGQFTKYLPRSLTLILGLITLVLSLLAVGSTFVAIASLDSARKGEKVDWELLVRNYKQTFWRSVAVVMISVFVLFLGYILVFARKPPLVPPNITFYSLISTLLIPLFSNYFSIYYAVEKRALFASVKSAIRFGIDNIAFSSLIIPYSLLVWWVANWLASPPSYLLFLSLLFPLLSSYLGLIIQASFLLYFMDRKASKT